MRRRFAVARERLRIVLHVARLRPFPTETEEGRSLERYRRIVLSTAASIAARVVASVASLIAVPLTIAYLGKEQYGFWAAVNALLPWAALFDLGIGSGLVNPISEAHGRDSDEDARASFSTAFFLLVAIALVLLVGLAVAVPLAPWSRVLAATTALPSSTVRASVAVAFGLTLLALPLTAVPQVYAGYQKSYVAVLFPAIGAVISLALLAATIHWNAGIVAVFAASAGGMAAGGFASLVVLVRREMPWLRPSPSHMSRRALRRLLATSVPLYVLQFGSLLVNQSQQLVLAQRAGLGAVAEYDLLLKLYTVVSTLVVITTSSVGPSLRESWERGDAGWMRRTFWHLMRVRMLMASFAAAGLLVGGNFALRVWLRRADFQYGTATWAVLALLLVAAVWVATFAELLTNLDRIWPQIAVVLAQGLSTVLLTWFLVQPFGTFGAVVAYAGPALLLSGWFLPRMARPLLAAPAGPARPHAE